MKLLLAALRYALAAVLVIVLVAFGYCWWVVQRALPGVDGTAAVPSLEHEVTIDRDALGVPHIRASSETDLFVAQGYVMAQDRLWQMDVLRRVAAGELSEIFGESTLELDRQFRTLGLRAAAEREAANIDAGFRAMAGAYARGVNRYIEARRGKLPWEFVALRYEPRPWEPADSLLVAGYMYQVLTTTWPSELLRAKVTAQVGEARARQLYVEDSPLDRFIVGGTAPGDKPAPNASEKPASRAADSPASHRLRQLKEAEGARETVAAWKEAKSVLGAFAGEMHEGAGSNNWVVDGRHTATGKPLLANDTHLQLSIPSIWYIVHLTAPGWNVKGFALPGAPGVIIGHNNRIAWGFTNNGADVQDLYLETFNPANPLEYRVNGKWVRAEVRKERIRVQGRPEEVLEVVSTRHGPIVHRREGHSYALRWTATEPGGLVGGFSALGRARNWEEFRQAMQNVPGPAQNAVYADVDGNIGFLVAARIPIRKNGNGSVPVRGDTDDYEWAGYIPFDELPQALNPPEGVMATANGRVVGSAYTRFLTDRWASPYRTARIYQMIEGKGKLTPADCITIQADLVSLPHRFLAEQLVRASQTQAPKDPRAHALIKKLEGWNGAATPDSVEMSFIEYTRIALMHKLLEPALGNDWAQYQWWRSGVFLERVLREQPRAWLPRNYVDFAEVLASSADEAVKELARETRGREPAEWGWGRFNQLEILHPLGRSGLLRKLLSIGPIPQAGSSTSVKQTGRSFGPAMRFVADLGNFDNSLMSVTVGQSGQLGSPNYRDEFSAWYEGRGLPSAFTDASEEKRRAHRLRLLPATTGLPR